MNTERPIIPATTDAWELVDLALQAAADQCTETNLLNDSGQWDGVEVKEHTRDVCLAILKAILSTHAAPATELLDERVEDED